MPPTELIQHAAGKQPIDRVQSGGRGEACQANIDTYTWPARSTQVIPCRVSKTSPMEVKENNFQCFSVF